MKDRDLGKVVGQAASHGVPEGGHEVLGEAGLQPDYVEADLTAPG